jgi:hypothetical protein
MSKYFVSRQVYWGVEPDEANTVEIAHGGLDYANPDMLVSKYPGEGQEYTNPIEAVEAAIEIAKAWKKDCPKLTINIAHGFTGGNTMPFEASSEKELIAWAKKVYETLPKCDQCGEILKEGSTYTLTDYPDEGKFCREFCAEEYLAKMLKETEEEVA